MGPFHKCLRETVHALAEQNSVEQTTAAAAQATPTRKVCRRERTQMSSRDRLNGLYAPSTIRCVCVACVCAHGKEIGCGAHIYASA